METILDNGVTFVKATALAKKYRYTTDYIGQLCRSGKVEAKLIGRAWFVNEASLINHKNVRYSSARAAEITINKSLVSDRATHPVALRREVRPVLSKSAHRSLMHVAEPKTYNFETRGLARVSTYHPDDELLEPVAKRKEQTVSELEPVHKVEEKAHKINVSLGEKATQKLAFEDLPEIPLRGDLTVNSLDDPDLFAEVEPVRAEHIQFAPESVRKPSVIVTKRYQPRTAQVPVAKTLETSVFEESSPQVQVVPKINFHPQTKTQQKEVSSKVRFVVVPVLVTSAILVCGVMLGLVSYAETDGLQFRQSFKFSPAAVIESITKVTESY
jgi:hypothetical protein